MRRGGRDVRCARLGEHLVGDEDRAVEAQRERDGVARARVDRDILAVGACEMERGDIGVVAQVSDDDVVESPTEALDEALHQIVRERARQRHALHLGGDRLRLEGPDPDRQRAARLALLDELHDR